MIDISKVEITYDGEPITYNYRPMLLNKEKCLTAEEIKTISEFDASDVSLPKPKPQSDIGMLRMIRDMVINHQEWQSFFERNVSLYLIASFAEEEILSLCNKRK